MRLRDARWPETVMIDGRRFDVDRPVWDGRHGQWYQTLDPVDRTDCTLYVTWTEAEDRQPSAAACRSVIHRKLAEARAVGRDWRARQRPA